MKARKTYVSNVCMYVVIKVKPIAMCSLMVSNSSLYTSYTIVHLMDTIVLTLSVA